MNTVIRGLSNITMEISMGAKKIKLFSYLPFIIAAVIGFTGTKAAFNYFLNPEKIIEKKQSAVNEPIKLNTPSVLPLTTPTSTLATNLHLTAAEETKKPAKLPVLNGIAYFGKESYALINNQIAREGDIIDGTAIIKIYRNEVELKIGDKVVKLKND